MADSSEPKSDTDPQPGLPLSEQPDEPKASEPLKVVDRRWWATANSTDASDASTELSRKPSYVEELEQQLLEKDELIQRTRAQFKGAEADFEQARVRLRREIAKDVERARRELLREFLEVADNLDRAIEAARASAQVQDLRAGVEMVRAQLLGTLQSFGVSRLDAVGQPFDPTVHEAVSTVETADAAAADTVVTVVKDGYVMGEELLRPAMVSVAKATPNIEAPLSPDSPHSEPTA